MGQRRQTWQSPAAFGFTLLELMIVVTILGIITSIGVPQYVSALRTARIAKAKHELKTLSREIDSYAATHGGRWPLSLYQIGFGGRRDPWGVPYCYLNYTDGTGDGLNWAIAAGLVDPAAFLGMDQSHKRETVAALPASAARSASEFATTADRKRPQLPPVLPPIIPPPVIPPQVIPPQVIPPVVERVVGAATQALVGTDISPAPTGETVTGRALASLNSVVSALARELSRDELDSLRTAMASPHGFSVFVGVPTDATRRRDRYMFPLNTDYDLFSLGPDCQTTVSLGQSVGQDDIIRANNGGYFGTASEY